jgi:glucose-6-phosphate 1-dehydrogenase
MHDNSTNPKGTMDNGLGKPTSDLDFLSATRLKIESQEPSILVIMGASGDLTARKLIPALFRLYLAGELPNPFLIVGSARTRFSDKQFRAKLTEQLSFQNEVEKDNWYAFAGSIFYRSMDYDRPESFHTLAEFLYELNQQHQARGNKLFYLALPPTLYQPVVELLGKAGLGLENEDGNGWSRLIVEKPFGRDYESAVELDHHIQKYFQEHQIFRIDHYLAKETVQNILMFRFANAIFEPIWNRRYIDYISILASETLGVEHRAGYYEQAGVIRDMFQNHMMQLLAMTAMEAPSQFESNRVRDEKIKFFRSLRPFPIDKLKEHIILGQYSSGEIDAHPVPAYRDEPGVRVESLTPTYAKMKVMVDNWRWQGIPFWLTSGKRMARKVTAITIHFKQIPHSMFRSLLGESIEANKLTLGIYPEEKITLTFQTKKPGSRVSLRSVDMVFCYHQNGAGTVLEAYEKVLIDCMLGNQMLFWRQDSLEACWSFLSPILLACETCDDRAQMLQFYPSGSWGPE